MYLLLEEPSTYSEINNSVGAAAATLAQVKVFGVTERLEIPQASLEALSTCDAVMLPLPALSNWIVTFWQSAIGATLSSTVMVEVHVLLLPLTSVTVKVTVLAPTLAQVKLLLSKL